jgi:hypothetical protein
MSRRKFWRRSSGERPIHWHVDEICGHSPSQSKRGIEHVVRRSNSWMMTFSGWLVPGGRSSAFMSARLLLKSHDVTVSRQVSFHLREDVSAHFGNSAFAMSGFRFEIPMSELAAGFYSVDLVAFSEASGETTVHLGRIELA